MTSARVAMIAMLLIAAPASSQAPETLAAAVHRLVGPTIDVAACGPPVSAQGELRYTCTRRECPGGCQVVHVVTTIALRAGHYRRVAQRREDRGDTGECGCCL